MLAEVAGLDGDGWFGSEGGRKRRWICKGEGVGTGTEEGEGEGRGVAGGPDRVLAVTEEKQTDLTVTNEASPLPQLPVFTPLTLHPVLRSSSLLLSTSDFFFLYKSLSFSTKCSLTPAFPISASTGL